MSATSDFVIDQYNDNASQTESNSNSNQDFPLYALLYLYETGNDRDLYCDYLAGFRALVDWLEPIAIPSKQSIPPRKILKLELSYELQQISFILNTSCEQILNGYQTTATLIQQQTNTTQLPKEIPTIQTWNCAKH